jgi:hypothetical protein
MGKCPHQALVSLKYNIFEFNGALKEVVARISWMCNKFINNNSIKIGFTT